MTEHNQTPADADDTEGHLQIRGRPRTPRATRDTRTNPRPRADEERRQRR